MNDEVHIAVIEERLNKLENVASDIGDIKCQLYSISAKLNGLDLDTINTTKTILSSHTKDIDNLKDDVGKIWKKIIYGSGIFAAIIFIVCWLVFPVIVSKVSQDHQPPITQSYEK